MISRRTLVVGAVAAPAFLAYAGRAGAVAAEPCFTLGVASGEPAADGMVLWTKLAPRPLQGDGGMPAKRVPVRWEIYADDSLRRMVKAGDAIADPKYGHSVHVEVSGLAPGRPYWYRFIANGETSPVGRTRTAPAAGAIADRLRFCFGSCQKYEDGYYGAWANAVADDPDLILFLGDYIYEAKPSVGTLRTHLNPAPFDVAGYRVRYATYRLDPLLQAAHAIAPWVVTWDDHEVSNDYSDLYDEFNTDPAVFSRQRAAAYQVYYEFMPLRRAARPRGDAMRLYRTIDWGRLAQFQVIDDRQYRSDRACQPAGSVAAHQRATSLIRDCAERHDPTRSILGATQDKWLFDALERTPALWNILAQQTQITSYPRHDPNQPDGAKDMLTSDTWESFPVSRERLLARWQDGGVSNPLVIGGDIHAFVASDLQRAGRTVAPSFIGGSITTNAGDMLLKANTAGDPAFRFADNSIRGYGRVDVHHDRCDVTFRAIRDPRDAATSAYDLARFTVAAGQPEMQTV